MGPLSRVAEFKELEIAAGTGANGPNGLQQLRFPATRLSDSPAEAKRRLFGLPASHPNDPEFSWKNVVPPAALGFISGTALGEQYDGDLIVGSAVARATNAGHLYRFRLNGGRTHLQFDDDRLKDGVADNTALDDFLTEGDEILFGVNFRHRHRYPDRAGRGAVHRRTERNRSEDLQAIGRGERAGPPGQTAAPFECGSEVELHGELHDPRVQCRRDRSEGGRAQHPGRRSEVHGVQQIEDFRTQLDGSTTTGRYQPHQGEINVLVGWSAHRVSRCSAE